MRLQRDATTRAARTSTRPRAAASTPRFARICLSTRSRRPARRVSPRLVPPQRPRRRVLVPRCPPFPSDDDPLPHPSQAREELARRADDRTRSILVLAQRFLLDDGLLESARALERESGVRLSQTDAADNVHLPGVIREWSAVRESTTGRRPKLTRAAGEDGEDAPPPRAPPRRGDRAPPPARNEEPRASPPSETRRASPSVVVATRRTPNAASRRMPNAEDAERRLSSPSASYGSDSTHARFDVPPGHPLLRKYAAGEGAGTRPEGGTTLSEALDFQAARRRARRGDAPAPGDERFGVDTADRAVAGSNPIGDGDDGDGDDGDDVSEDRDDATRRVLKPPPSFGGCAESRALAATISRDIYARNPNVRWGDVAGLDEAKRLLKEAVVMPVKYPQFFHGLLEPWRGVLLYGPPGTGKTMLAKAVATECGTTFFNIGASSIVSKWRGDSEKLVRVLFDLARHHAPSTIFMDELDAVMSARDGGARGGGDHESSRRLKTELLIQLDGLARGDELVFLLAATNLPWELDPAMLRRLEKRVYVPLPTAEARIRMTRALLAPHDVSPEVDVDAVATRAEGYSGSDIALLCKECAIRPLRRLMSRLDDDLNPTEGEEAATLGPITAEDAAGAEEACKPSFTDAHARRYEEWTASFGVRV